MMPKHVFEGKDPLKFDFNPPVSLGAYTLKNYDPNGQWFIWQKRDDWKRTTVARFGEPGPNYIAYIDPGPPDKRVIEQKNHQLDIIHDTSPEGMFSLAKQSPSSHGWFKGFPYGHPDPTLAGGDLQSPAREVPEQGRALGVGSAHRHQGRRRWRPIAARRRSPRSASRRPAPIPKYYFEPLQDWLKDFEIDTGKSEVKPYDPTVGQQIADMLRPSMGDQIPTDPKEIANAFGTGWWKPNPQAATELLERAGFKKQGGTWKMPDGKPFTIKLMVEGDARPVMTRAGTMIAQQWKQFGIDAQVEVAQGTFFDRRGAGDFEALIGWSVETWGGHPDLSFFLDSWHSQFVAAAGQDPAAAQLAALEQPGPRQDHRADPHHRLRRSQGHRAWPGVREAGRPGDADASRSCRTTCSRSWTRPTGLATRARKRLPTRIRCRTGATPST